MKEEVSFLTANSRGQEQHFKTFLENRLGDFLLILFYTAAIDTALIPHIFLKLANALTNDICASL